MENTDFFLDLLKILPQEVTCFIQAPSIEDEGILNMMKYSETRSSKYVNLNLLNRTSFIKLFENNPDLTQYFHSIEIDSINDKKLFEGWDGVEYGHISKDIEIPNWFKEKYFDKEMYHISDEW